MSVRYDSEYDIYWDAHDDIEAEQPEEPTEAEIERQTANAVARYSVSHETARSYVLFKFEGYSSSMARILSGIDNPPD